MRSPSITPGAAGTVGFLANGSLTYTPALLLLRQRACSNSWRGVHGAAHGRSYTHTLRSGRFEETAPIMWLLFGVGALNAATLPATALATAEHYQVPPVVRALAATLPEQWYGRQVYKGEYRLERPAHSGVRIGPADLADPRRDALQRPGLPLRPARAAGAHLGRHTQLRDPGIRDPPRHLRHQFLGSTERVGGTTVLPRCTKTATPCSCCIASPPETGWELHTCGSRPSCSMSGGPTARGSLVGTATATSRSPPGLVPAAAHRRRRDAVLVAGRPRT